VDAIKSLGRAAVNRKFQKNLYLLAIANNPANLAQILWPTTASDVMHQVVDLGRITNFLFAQFAHSYGGERNKDETGSEAID